MSWDAEKFTKELEEVVRVFDHEAAAEMCGGLVAHLSVNDDPYPPKQAEAVLGVLRRKRFFNLMEQVANALILTKRATLKVRRQYAQSLIDQNNLEAVQKAGDKRFNPNLWRPATPYGALSASHRTINRVITRWIIASLLSARYS